MSSEKSYARLGLFIVVTLFVVLATATFFIQRLRSRPGITMVTYTSENVSGLDVSSPVRLQGVPVGHVTDLRVDTRGHTIEIDFEVFLDRLSNIGVDIKQLQNRAKVGYLFPKLRAKILSNPITGEAYLLLEESQNPPPPMALGFTPTKPYVPSMPSMTTTVQDTMPALLDRTEQLLRTFRDVSTRLPDSLDRSDRFFNNAERIVRESQLPALSSDSRKFFATTTEQIEQMREQTEQMRADLDRTEATLVKLSDDTRATLKDADLPAATQSMREAADNSTLVREDLQRSLPAIRDSLGQLRELARQLQEQPESVVYGPRPATGKH